MTISSLGGNTNWFPLVFMRDFTESLQIAPTLPVQQLVKDLTIGQRATVTRGQLSSFLHEHIFPKLAPYCVEIYYQKSHSDSYLPSRLPDQTASGNEHVPDNIPKALPLIEQIFETGCPAELDRSSLAALFSTPTDNRSHLLVPLQDGPERLGLLYLGGRTPCSFTPCYLDAVQTLAAVIGSRLKSMATIQQLQESMHALEYSDRLRTALYEISELAHNSENINDLYARLHQTMDRLIHAENFFIALVEKRPEGKYIQFPYYADQIDTHFQGMELQLDQKKCSITGYLLKNRQPLLLTPGNFARICRDHNIECIGTRPYSWLGAPFFVGHISGAVAIQSYSDIIYTEKDKELLSFVARHIGDALNRKRAVDELKKSKDKAERVEKNKSNFLANMSHEIRTPMNGILGLTDLVLHSDISGQKRTYLEMIHSSAERLLKLINDILDFSKIEAGKLDLDIAPFSLRETIADALEILAVSAAKKNIRLTVDCQESIPDLLLGDGDKLNQILINLVGNGIKFTNQGEVNLTIDWNGNDDGQRDGLDLHFQIRDTGIGIPKAKTKNIFKAFSQLTTTRSSSQRGTGLGLVIASELVEMMGGKILVDSEQGVGTTFHFTIRFASGQNKSIARQTSEPVPHPATAARLREKSLHILLVEDEFINRTLATTVLEREGCQVTVAENGIQAIKLVQVTVFDLILMDIQMPELDGYGTTRAIRRLEKRSRRHTPIIAVTAYAVKGDREKCLTAGMDGYISKPIKPELLRSEIETVLYSGQSVRTSPKPHS